MEKTEEIANSIISKLSEQDIEYLKEHKTLPAIKLSHYEMEALKGGRLIDYIMDKFGWVDTSSLNKPL